MAVTNGPGVFFGAFAFPFVLGLDFLYYYHLHFVRFPFAYLARPLLDEKGGKDTYRQAGTGNSLAAPGIGSFAFMEMGPLLYTILHRMIPHHIP